MKFSRILGAALVVVALLGHETIAHAQQVNAQTGTTYTFLNTDCSKLVTFSNASAVAVTLPQASSQAGGGSASGLFMPPCRIEVVNLGAGLVTITPTTSTLGGASSAAFGTGASSVIISDGTNYQLEAGGNGLASWSANGSVATALSSIGPTGSHTTVQEWFTVKDAAGTVRYIPAF